MARLARSLAAPFALAAAAALAGCDDSASSAGLDAEVRELRGQVKKLEGDRDRLSNRLETAERRLAGLQEDLISVRNQAQTPAATAAAAAPADGADGAPGASRPGSSGPAAAAKDLTDALATEDGRRAFEAAMRAYEQKRDEERGARAAQGLVEQFAQRANLSPEQRAKLDAIVARSVTAFGDVWRSMRDPNLTPEQRGALRTEAVAKMEEIRTRTDDEVKGILDAAQWDLYQQESARMRGFLSGAGGGGFGGPGGGGFGGRGR